ncbi:MAG: alanine dehydrogenase [Bacilli bacterium]
MIVGVPKEIKDNEDRVAMTPAGARALTGSGHQVLIESGAGLGSGFTDEDYRAAGGDMIATAESVWADADMIMKVKEPLPAEYGFFRENLILFTYLHLAPEYELTSALMKSKVVAIAYETIQLPDRSLPLLTPMSEVAGRMSVQIGAEFLEKPYGGKGILLGGVPGVLPGRVVIVGGGIVGANAAKMALGTGAEVTIIDVNAERLRQLDDMFSGRVRTLMSNEYNIEMAVRSADLLIGAVLIPGSRAPKLVTEAMVKEMSRGSVIVDVAIDQGGSIATIDRVTTHSHPTYEKHGVIHYAVANMPGAVARTSTLALTNVTLGYALQLAGKGYRAAIRANLALAKGINVVAGKVTYEAVARGLEIDYTPLEDAIDAAAE